MIKIPQIFTITRNDFNNSNKELHEDLPGNHETIDEHINRTIDDINEMHGPVERVEFNLQAKNLEIYDSNKQLRCTNASEGNTILAVIYYSRIIKTKK